MILRKQPGCWLRSSHTFKECVIAHWSSEVARKITGAKLYTEIADSYVLNNIYYKREIFSVENFRFQLKKEKKKVYTKKW